MKYPNDWKTAIELYYGRIELGNGDIKKLFQCGDNAAIKLKRPVQEEMAKKNILPWKAGNVNTELAFKVWGLNIADIERRYAKLQKILEKEEKHEAAG